MPFSTWDLSTTQRNRHAQRSIQSFFPAFDFAGKPVQCKRSKKIGLSAHEVSLWRYCYPYFRQKYLAGVETGLALFWLVVLQVQP